MLKTGEHSAVGLVFATETVGILVEGGNGITIPHNAALAVTANGRRSWRFTGNRFVRKRGCPNPRDSLLPGREPTTVMAPRVVPSY